MNRKRSFSIVVALLLAFFTVSAQDNSPRQILEQAEEAYQIGRILEAQTLLKGCVKNLGDAQRLAGYRLLSLCCLALDQQDEARHYAELVLKENPYYTPTIEYPPRFVDMINDIKQGFIATISTASNQSESVNEAPVPITIITAEMIEELGYNKNLNQILAAYVPGMAEVAPESPGENLAMHGAYTYGQELILIMENGHRLNSRFNNIGTTGYSISLEKIDHIEVLRGPASSLYGNVALSAVVNIITKSGREINGIKARYGYGSYNTHRVDLLMGTQFMDADISAWASLYRSDGQIRHFNDGEGYYANHLSDSFSFDEARLNTCLGPDRLYVDSYRDTPSYDLGFTFMLKGFNAMVSYKRTKKLFQHANFTGYDYDIYPNILGIKPGVGNEEMHIELGYTRQLGRFSLNASLNGSWNTSNIYSVNYDTLYIKSADVIDEVEISDEAIDPDDETIVQYKGTDVGNYKESSYGGVIKVATDYRFSNMWGNLLVGCHFEHFSVNSMVDMDNSEETGYVFLPDETLADGGREDNLSLFVQDKHYFTPQFILNAGLRFDKRFRQQDQLTNFSPRLALMYVPSDRFSLKLSYAEAFADLAFYYRYILTNVFKVDPQHLSALQLTAMGKVVPWHLNYEINLFYNHFTHLPCWLSREDDENFDINKSVNNGQMKNVGIEATARYTNQRLMCGLNLYYCHIVSCENYYYNNIENRVTAVPHFTMGLSGAYKFFQTASHELKVYGHASYIGRQLIQTNVVKDDYYLKAQALFDLGIKYSYRQRLNISLDCENLLNSDHYVVEPISDRHPIFQRGRTLMASVAYTF